MTRILVVLACCGFMMAPLAEDPCSAEEPLETETVDIGNTDGSGDAFQESSGLQSPGQGAEPFLSGQEDILVSTANDLKLPENEAGGSLTVESDALKSTANGAFVVETTQTSKAGDEEGF